MSIDHIDWKCDECDTSPDVLYRIVKDFGNGTYKKFLCKKCKEKEDKKK